MSLFDGGGSFLYELGPADREELLSLGPSRTYRPREPIVHEHDTTNFVLVIRNGWSIVSVSTKRGTLILALRGPGDLVGDMAAVDGRPRSASVTAVGRVDGVVIQGDHFRSFLASRPKANSLVMQQFAGRLRNSDSERRSLASLTVLERLAARLVELAERAGTRQGDAVVIDLPLPQHDLAAAVGSTREAVAKALRMLREQGVVRTGPRRLTVADLDVLSALAGGA
jgi:CRP/FNR family transcriptional regulator, cyclic AMP receptor protein